MKKWCLLIICLFIVGVFAVFSAADVAPPPPPPAPAEPGAVVDEGINAQDTADSQDQQTTDDDIIPNSGSGSSSTSSYRNAPQDTAQRVDDVNINNNVRLPQQQQIPSSLPGTSSPQPPVQQGQTQPMQSVGGNILSLKFIIIIGVSIVAFVGVIFLIVFLMRKRKTRVYQPVPKNLQDYVTAVVQKYGECDEHTKENLIQHGWPENLVNNAVANAEQ